MSHTCGRAIAVKIACVCVCVCACARLYIYSPPHVRKVEVVPRRQLVVENEDSIVRQRSIDFARQLCDTLCDFFDRNFAAPVPLEPVRSATSNRGRYYHKSMNKNENVK